MPNDETFVMEGFSPEIQAMMGVHALYWKLEETIDDLATDPELSRNELHLMVKLDRPKRMGVLARDLLAAPSTLTATTDNLEAKGYLKRQRDPKDRRAWLLVLTTLGQDVRQTVVTRAGEMFHQASGLNCEETEEFARLARKIRENILKTGIPEGLKK